MITKTDEEWQDQLSAESFYVCRKHGTEPPFSGKYNEFKDEGIFTCICCGAPLFESTTKFNSGTGWPSYYDCIQGAITEIEDNSLAMRRVEVRCSNCDSHLGHVFPDGPAPTGLRYCINSVSLDFEENK